MVQAPRTNARRREQNRVNAAAHRARLRLQSTFLSQRIEYVWQNIRQLFESMDNRYRAVMNPVATEEMVLELHERRELLDEERALVKLQFQDAMKSCRSLRELLRPSPRTRLNLNLYHVRHLSLSPPIAVSTSRCHELVDQACEELATFDPPLGVHAQFAPVRGWNAQVWNSGTSQVNVEGSICVDWDVEIAVKETWEILTSPSKNRDILLDLPNDGKMQVQQLISDDLVVVQRYVQPPLVIYLESLEPREFVSVLFRRRIGSTFVIGMKSLPVTEQAGYSYPTQLRGQELRGWIFTPNPDPFAFQPWIVQVLSSCDVRCPFDECVLTGLANLAISSMLEWERKVVIES